MFNDALMESESQLKTKSRYFSLVSFTLNALLLLALILWPLLHPLALPKQALSMLLIAPAPPAPALPVSRTATPPRPQSAPVQMLSQLLAPSHTPTTISTVAEAGPPQSTTVQGSTGDPSSGLPSGILDSPGTRAVPAPRVLPPPPKKVILSGGVIAGNKLSGLDPRYPAIAQTARIQGTVVLQATISTAGTIENLRVLSGSPMLSASAIEAVKGWRYRPYLLNGQPVEVETTINVIFSLNQP